MVAVKDSGLRWLWVAVLCVVIDQFTKWLTVHYLPYGYPGVPITSFFNLVHVYNPGAAFSFLADQGGWQRWFFSLLAVGVCGVLGLWLRRQPYTAYGSNLAFNLIIGGALGNAIDRLWLGHVVDFLDFYLGTYHWPAFNIADTAIFIGAAVMLWDGMGKKPDQPTP